MEHELRTIWSSSYGQRKLALGAAYADPESVVDFSVPGTYPVPCPDCGLALTVYSYKLDEAESLLEFERCRCDEDEFADATDDESSEEGDSAANDKPADVVLETTVKYDVPKDESARLCADRNRKREEECIRGLVSQSPFIKARKI